MVEEFLRQVTHNKEQFETEWSHISERLSDLFDAWDENAVDISMLKVKGMNAIVDYVLAESSVSVTPINEKVNFVEFVIEQCAKDPLPSPKEIVGIVQRILDSGSIFNLWYLNAVEAFHSKCQFCQHLISTKSYDLIESFLQSFLKHEFLDDQADEETKGRWEHYLSRELFSPFSSGSDYLNGETIMNARRTIFQKIFR